MKQRRKGIPHVFALVMVFPLKILSVEKIGFISQSPFFCSPVFAKQKMSASENRKFLGFAVVGRTLRHD